MQKKNYQQFVDQQGSEMINYPTGIPIGQPIQQNAYPNHLPHEPIYHQQQFAQQSAPQYTQPQQVYQNAFVAQPQPFALPPPAPVIPNQNYNYPLTIVCPCCKVTVPTVVNKQSGNTAYLWCGFLFCFVSPLCCCLPFMMESCLDKSHYCPNCGHNILRKHQKCFQFIGC